MASQQEPINRPGLESTTDRQILYQDKLEEEYWSLLSETERHTNLSFVENLRWQDATQQEQGRAAVLTFSDSGPAEAQIFHGPEDLRMHLDDAANSNATCAPFRRLYLLEDLARKYVEILGSRLRIPPALFGAQWTDPSFSSPLIDPETLSQDRGRYFQLKYRQIHKLREDGAEDNQLGLYRDAHSNISRWLQLLDKDSPFELSRHQVSYWSNSFLDRSWVAVLLLDPLITEASITSRYATNGEHIIRLDHPVSESTGHSSVNFRSMHPLSLDPEEWKITSQSPHLLSVFDDLISIHTHADHTQLAKDPTSVVSVCRHLILHTWETYIVSRTAEYHINVDKFLFKNPITKSASWFQVWDIIWRADVFRRLTFAKLAIEDAVTNDISTNLKALGVGYSNTVLSPDESEEWKNLLSSGAALSNKYTVFIDAYIQEATIQESQTSNHQARSVGRLTALATVLVPFSIIAGMFSMGGEFLAGQSHFWVFWAVTIPVVVGVAIALFTGVLQTGWIFCVFLWRRVF